MKLALSTLSLAFASAQASSLRAEQAVVNTVPNPTDEKLLTSKIVLQGTTGEPTSDDMDFLGKALVSSYNDVHWEVGHLMNSPNAIDFKGSEIADALAVFEVATPIQLWWGPGRGTWWKYRGIYIPPALCRHCPDDDAMAGVLDSQSLLTTPISEDCAGLCNDKATAELEVNFCDRIKSSQGSTYLSSTTACAISFDVQEDGEDNEEANDKNAEEEETHEKDPVATLDTTIVLKGVGAGEPTQEEHAILAKAFVAAYNDVHWKDSHHLDDAEIPFIAARETEAASASSNTLVLDIVTPVQLWWGPGRGTWWKYRGIYIPPALCRHCPDDDAMGAANMEEFDVQTIPSNAFDKEAIEVAFCRKIQNSSSDKLASTESCSIAVETLQEVASENVVG